MRAVSGWHIMLLLVDFVMFCFVFCGGSDVIGVGT